MRDCSTSVKGCSTSKKNPACGGASERADNQRSSNDRNSDRFLRLFKTTRHFGFDFGFTGVFLGNNWSPDHLHWPCRHPSRAALSQTPTLPKPLIPKISRVSRPEFFPFRLDTNSPKSTQQRHISTKPIQAQQVQSIQSRSAIPPQGQ